LTDKLSTLLIRESSDLDDATEDDMELFEENFKDFRSHSKRLFASQSEID